MGTGTAEEVAVAAEAAELAAATEVGPVPRMRRWAATTEPRQAAARPNRRRRTRSWRRGGKPSSCDGPCWRTASPRTPEGGGEEGARELSDAGQEYDDAVGEGGEKEGEGEMGKGVEEGEGGEEGEAGVEMAVEMEGVGAEAAQSAQQRLDEAQLLLSHGQVVGGGEAPMEE